MNSCKFVFLELCNFEDYPLGGHLSFARNMVSAFQGEIALVGISTSVKDPVGVWFKKEINGVKFDFFSVMRIRVKSKKPFIPARLSGFLHVLFYKDKILKHYCKNYIIQTPEVLFNFWNNKNIKKCLIFPGLENPLKKSRYPLARNFSFIYEKLFNRMILKADLLLAAADKDTISKFSSRIGELRLNPRIVQFPTRFDSDIFRYRDKIQVRKELGLDSGKIVIVTSGRLNYFKGWKLLIDSFLLFKNIKPNSIFYFLGEGEDRALIEDYIKKNQLSNSVFLKGFVNQFDLAYYLNSADLFVMGSFAEGWSTSLVEAVVSGVPICTTKFSSAEELVSNSINGFVVNNRNPLEFSKFMLKAICLKKENLLEKSNEISKLSLKYLKRDFLNHWNGQK